MIYFKYFESSYPQIYHESSL